MNNNKRLCATKILSICALSLFLVAQPIAAQEEDTMMMKAAKSIANGAMGRVGGEAAGWVMGLLGLGGSSGLNPQVMKELQAIDGQLKTIEMNMQQIEQSTIALYKQEVANEAQGIINSLSVAVGAIEPYWTTYSLMLSSQSATPGQMATLSKSIINNVPAQLDAIDMLLTAPSASGGTGLMEVYANVISNASFPDNATPVRGDTPYYQNLHNVLAYYNLWRLRAVIMLVDAYHYQALQASSGSIPSNVCSQAAATLSCNLAAHYANRFFNSSSANSNAGIIAQLQIAGDSVANPQVIPLTVPQMVNGTLQVQPTLWARTLFQSFPAMMFPGQGGPDWMPPDMSAWTPVSDATQTGSPEHIFYGQPTPAQANGYQSWRVAAKSDVQTLLKAYAGTSTVKATLSADFPSLFAQASYIMLGLPIPFETANSTNCYLNLLAGDAALGNAYDCGTLVAGGQHENGISADGPYGPMWAHFCLTSVGPCESHQIPHWTLASNETKPGPAAMTVAPWPVTDASGCPSGQTATNSAGWLKPCGNSWVQQKYQDVLPNAQVQARLDQASLDVQPFLK